MNIGKEVAALERMTMKELRGRYAEVFGDSTNANNKVWLIKRIAWRIQALAEGDLSERARKRAAELANDADVRLSPPKMMATPASPERTKTVAVPSSCENRLPTPGTILTRPYKGRMLVVKVLSDGFELEGEIYKSLSALANTVTGTHCNGFHFFGLNKKETT